MTVETKNQNDTGLRIITNNAFLYLKILQQEKCMKNQDSNTQDQNGIVGRRIGLKCCRLFCKDLFSEMIKTKRELKWICRKCDILFIRIISHPFGLLLFLKIFLLLE
jgi:hypothetical protein